MQEMEKSLKLTMEMEDSMAQLSDSIHSPSSVDASNGSYTTAFMDFHSGSGGEDASDWTHMLFDMYQRFAKQMGWSCRVVTSQQEGSGLRSGVLRIDGDESAPFSRRKRESTVSFAYRPSTKTVVATRPSPR